uniref:CCHC-type domain-containing protein n=1 Tax=Crocodylus porosus TaxID=8502 RepID=A0A7M4E513_CROPO
IFMFIPMGKWVSLSMFPLNLTQAAHRAMSRSDAMDYETVKGEILRRLDITPERHRQAFRDKKPAEVRTPRILWQMLADLLGKWLRPESTPKEQILDLVLMEQFIFDLEEETRNWVRCHCPTSSREALQWAEQFNTAQGERCQTGGPKMPELTTRRVTDSKAGKRGGGQGPTCFTCGGKGHFARNCPQGTRQDPFRDKYHQEHHPVPEGAPEPETMDCGVASHPPAPIQPLPQVQAWVEGVPIQAVVDTGCTQSLVRLSMVRWKRAPRG